MKQALLLLTAMGVAGLSSGVGASSPQSLIVANTQLAAVNVDTGASNYWTARTTHNVASKREIKKFELRVEGIDTKMDDELDALISQKIDDLLEADQ